MSASGLVVDVLLTVVQIIVFLYDVLSYPIYRFLGRALSQVMWMRRQWTYCQMSAFCNNSEPFY